MKTESTTSRHHFLCLLLVLSFSAPATPLLSECLMKIGRCIMKNGIGKRSKVLIYRENELTGETENNESAAFPVEISNSKFKKLDGYDSLRVIIGNITEIRIKTGMRVKPLVWANNENQNYYFYMPIKFGFPKTFKTPRDYLHSDFTVDYSKLAGRKIKMFLSHYGEKIILRCTVIVPCAAKYTGYLFPERPYLKNSTFIPLFDKEDYLQDKETIKRKDLSKTMASIMQIREEASIKLGKSLKADKGPKTKADKKKRKKSRKHGNNKKAKEYNKVSKAHKIQQATSKKGEKDKFADSDATDSQADVTIHTDIVDVRDQEDHHDLEEHENQSHPSKESNSQESEPSKAQDLHEDISFAGDIDYYFVQEENVKRNFSLDNAIKKYQKKDHKKNSRVLVLGQQTATDQRILKDSDAEAVNSIASKQQTLGVTGKGRGKANDLENVGKSLLNEKNGNAGTGDSQKANIGNISVGSQGVDSSDSLNTQNVTSSQNVEGSDPTKRGIELI